MANEILVTGWRKPKGRYILDMEYRVDFDWGDGVERRAYDRSFVLPHTVNTLAKLNTAVKADYDKVKADVAVLPPSPTAVETALTGLVGQEFDR